MTLMSNTNTFETGDLAQMIAPGLLAEMVLETTDIALWLSATGVIEKLHTGPDFRGSNGIYSWLGEPLTELLTRESADELDLRLKMLTQNGDASPQLVELDHRADGSMPALPVRYRIFLARPVKCFLLLGQDQRMQSGSRQNGNGVSNGQTNGYGNDPQVVKDEIHVTTEDKLLATVDKASLRSLLGSKSLKYIVSEVTDVIEKVCIGAAAEHTANNRAAAAELLGLSRQSLYVKLRKYGLMSGSDMDMGEPIRVQSGDRPQDHR